MSVVGARIERTMRSRTVLFAKPVEAKQLTKSEDLVESTNSIYYTGGACIADLSRGWNPADSTEILRLDCV